MSPSTMLVLLAAVALLGVAAVRWQRTFVMSLPLLATLNGVSVPLGGASMRFDQLAACALVVPLAAAILIGRRRLLADRTMWCLGAILVMNVLASVLHSPARAYSLVQCANLALVWVIYVVVLNLLDTREDIEAFFHRALWAAGIASGVAVAAYVLAVSGLPVGGAEVSTSAARRLTNAYGAHGTMVEPNILGGFAAAYLVLSISLLTIGAEQPELARQRRLARWVATCAAIALVLTFTRGAWVGAVAGVVCLALVRGRGVVARIRVRHVAIPLAAASVLVVALLAAPGDAGSLFRFKLFNLLNIETQTGVVRVVSYALAVQQTAEHPIVGWGTFTFAPLVAEGSDFQQFDNWRNLWIGNYLLLAVHDTGLVGLALWIAMLWGLVKRGARTVRRASHADPVVAGRTLALTLAVVTLLVAFLATSGFSLGYAWVIIGLLGAHQRLANDELASASADVPAAAGDRDAADSFAPVG